tara:strand:- start:6940 stop:7365 length:426 start_codon:yes stop_codon:yes gene_type:complete
VIKYNLKCKNCSNNFDSWFSSSKEFEKLKKNKYLNCPNCNSLSVDKSLMAPSLFNTKKNNKSLESFKTNEIKKKIKEYQKFIKHNFEYVGENFTYEARSIHYGGKKRKKGIYGKAKNEEIKELNEEGIETESIPWVYDKEN